MDELDYRRSLETKLGLFTHPGWKLIVEDIQEALESLEKIDSVTENEPLEFRKGQVERLRMFLQMPEFTRRLIDNLDLAEEDAEDI